MQYTTIHIYSTKWVRISNQQHLHNVQEAIQHIIRSYLLIDRCLKQLPESSLKAILHPLLSSKISILFLLFSSTNHINSLTATNQTRPLPPTVSSMIISYWHSPRKLPTLVPQKPTSKLSHFAKYWINFCHQVVESTCKTLTISGSWCTHSVHSVSSKETTAFLSLRLHYNISMGVIYTFLPTLSV